MYIFLILKHDFKKILRGVSYLKEKKTGLKEKDWLRAS